jgi:hypothetical protein
MQLRIVLRNLKKKREKCPSTGGGLGRIYKEAILKRIRHLREEKQKGQGK